MKSKIFFHFFIFLFGFFVGNLFPTFFGHVVGSVTSFFLLLILEGFNFINIKGEALSSTRMFSIKYINSKLNEGGLPLSFDKVILSVFNSLKIGILFGLFVDAFKVGS